MSAIQVSQQFVDAVEWALAQARNSSDPAVSYMAQNVPVYMMFKPTPQQAYAGGCPNCHYLGLWANTWPGLEDTPHGTIWLFESGIRRGGGDLYDKALYTLLHEMDHALQRDHVLERLGLPVQVAAASEYDEERGDRG